MHRNVTREKRVHYVCGKRHNASKVRVFMILFHRANVLHKTTGLSVGDLAKQSGVPVSYIKNRAPQWMQWSYLNRSFITKNGRPCFAYTLAARGEFYIRYTLPDEWRNYYVNEIRIHQRGAL